MESNSEMAQAVVNNNLEAAANREQYGELDSFDSDQSANTVTSKNDSTYVEEESSASSTSEEFHDTILLEKLKNITTITELQPEVRKRKKSDRFGFSNMCVNADFNLYGDQITYKEAVSGSESQEWNIAVAEELKAFKENQAWEVVDKPDHATVVKCK